MKTKTKRTRGKNRTTLFREMVRDSSNMNYKDLKRNCVVRGMPFEDVINGSFPRLQVWLHHNVGKEIIPHLLDDFDDYVEEKLRERGADDLIHPQLRLGFIGERDEEGNAVKIKRVKGIKKKRRKRERTKDGIYKGTKKAYVYEAQQKGWTLKKTIRRTFAKFPDASEKSIKIWYKKSERMRRNEEG